MEDYSNIIEFIKDFTYPDHDMIENCPYDGYSSGIYAFEKREVVRGEDTISFENEGDFIKHLSFNTAQLCIKDNSYLLSNEPDIMIGESYHIISVQPVSVVCPKFSIADGDSVYFVDLLSINPIDKVFFDTFVWNYCAEYVMNELKKLTRYRIDMVTMHHSARKTLFYTNVVDVINNIEQLCEFVLLQEKYLTLLYDNNILNRKIHISSQKLSFNYEELPRFVDLPITIAKGSVSNKILWEDEFSTKIDIRFQIVVNADKSISLIPFGPDLKSVLFSQLFLLNIIYEGNCLIIDKSSKDIINFLITNKIIFRGKKLIRTLEYDEMISWAKYLDSNEIPLPGSQNVYNPWYCYLAQNDYLVVEYVPVGYEYEIDG